jgi:hypothetical protein
MKNPHHWIWCDFMRFGQLSNLGVFEAFDLATVVQWSKTNYSTWKVGIWGWCEKKCNIWTCWIQKKWMVKFAHTMSFTNKPFKKKASYFYCSRACCWGPVPPRILLPTSPSELEIFFLVATAVTLSIAFLLPIGDTCKSHVNVHGHCDKIYHQLMATQVKFPKEISGHRGSSQLKARFGVKAQNNWGQLWAFWAFCWPQLTNTR